MEFFLFVLVDWTNIYPGTDSSGGQLTTIAKKTHVTPTDLPSFAKLINKGVYHCHIFSFEVNIERIMTTEAQTTPGNDEADERELHLSSIVACNQSVAAAAAFSCSSF
ncbi:hypothetical protein CEXT_225571 [Caerostris extrusa]|uniref:Uncharacterized protein n=1 Tax=Caerostris extrusa TaxID=172846 RepID=A0AAV4PNS0_CAEEX|nr:hypothetical protein CEXT_225571 [Caerostris extrusa]